MSEPKPMPLRAEGMYVYGQDGRLVADTSLMDGIEPCEAMAALIARAVNSHRDLVEALGEIRTMVESSEEDPDKVLAAIGRVARAALAKARPEGAPE